VIQVLVYAGGIVVLYLFVVMLVNLKRPARGVPVDTRRQSRLGVHPGGGAAGGGSAIARLQRRAAGRRRPGAGLRAGPATPRPVGMLLYTDYLVPFEVASMLLLVAMIGAIVLAKEGSLMERRTPCSRSRPATTWCSRRRCSSSA
jgi:NADH-quinone oxidoreductase subunit J